MSLIENKNIEKSRRSFSPTQRKLFTQKRQNVKTSIHKSAKNQTTVKSGVEESSNILPLRKPFHHLLPSSSPIFIQNIREKARQNQAQDVFDIREEGKNEDVSKENLPIEKKLLKLKMLNNEFEKRFSQAWGPLQYLDRNEVFFGVSGELIEYFVYINPKGQLVRYENISAKKNKSKNYSSIDKIFDRVIRLTLPIVMPPNIENLTIKRVQIEYVGEKSPLYLLRD